MHHGSAHQFGAELRTQFAQTGKQLGIGRFDIIGLPFDPKVDVAAVNRVIPPGNRWIRMLQKTQWPGTWVPVQAIR